MIMLMKVINSLAIFMLVMINISFIPRLIVNYCQHMMKKRREYLSKFHKFQS